MALSTAAAAHSYSRSSSFSAVRSPDTASSIYPERAIRPLPKSRLKSRLSPEQVSSIKYPPNSTPISPTLNFSPPSTTVDAISNGDITDGHHYHRHEAALVHEHCSCQHGDGESGDEEVEFDHPDYRYATSTSPLAASGKGGQTYDAVQRRLRDAAKIDGNAPKAVGSTTSSADGYESFENTSNKKKRKIPLTTISAAHPNGLTAELANMGIRQDELDELAEAAISDRKPHAGQPHDHVVGQRDAAGTGISGAGRGRYGRRDAKDGRRPLAATTANAPNGHAGRPGPDVKDLDPESALPNANTPGIISRAIRAAETGSLASPKGKENVSLLQQSASAGASPKTQFTFTCESDSGNKLIEQQPLHRDQYRERPTHAPPAPSYANKQRGANNMPRQGPSMSNAQARGQAQAQMPPPPAAQAQQPVQKPPRPRRSPSKEYALAARQRKIQQQFSNYHHRPRREDMWICQFCEYEDIFGVPPVALIRAYEIKDRQERKKAAEKRRLLEKAKQRGRKGKKGSKGTGNKNNAVANTPAPAQDQRYDQHGDPLDGGDYFDDEDEDGYGNEYDPVVPEGDDAEYDTGGYYEHPPPVPIGTPQPLMSHNRAADKTVSPTAYKYHDGPVFAVYKGEAYIRTWLKHDEVRTLWIEVAGRQRDVKNYVDKCESILLHAELREQVHAVEQLARDISDLSGRLDDSYLYDRGLGAYFGPAALIMPGELERAYRQAEQLLKQAQLDLTSFDSRWERFKDECGDILNMTILLADMSLRGDGSDTETSSH